MKLEFSAGGIVFKKVDDTVLWLICQHSQHKGWVFAKGFIGDKKKGEKPEEAALREVEEEGGVKGKIVKKLTPVTYFYKYEGQLIKKTVYYFLMEYLSGDPKNHDWEMSDAKFMTEEEVRQTLTYPSDKKAFEEGLLAFRKSL